MTVTGEPDDEEVSQETSDDSDDSDAGLAKALSVHPKSTKKQN